MYRKNCNQCNESSYSCSEYGDWICPVCGNDLTDEPLYDPFSFERVFIPERNVEKKIPSSKVVQKNKKL